MPKFSLAHLTAITVPTPELVEIAAAAGYDFVSIRPISMPVPGQPDYSLAKNPELLRDTRKALGATGIKVFDIELARVLDSVDVKSYEPEIAASAELGAKSLICSVWSDDRAAMTDKYGELCDIAGKYGINVDLEFVCIASIRRMADAAEMIRKANRPNGGILIDMMHFHAAGEKAEDIEKIPKEWFHFVHLCDVPGVLPTEREPLVQIVRDGRLYLGEGGVDLPGMLKRIPPGTVYSLELPNAKRYAELGPLGHAKKCLTTAKAYFEKLGIADRA